MEQSELYYRLALSLVNGIGPVKYKKLISHFGSAENIFKQNQKSVGKSGLLSDANVEALLSFRDFKKVEAELEFIDRNNIRVFCFDDFHYPQKLKSCIDCPVLLFQRGEYKWNEQRIVSVIGTRTFTEYGRKLCEEFIEQLQPYNVTIVSGLAYGIDIIAHKAALKFQMPTIGVVAHGLSTMYPDSHRGIAKQMQENGAVLSEYFSDTILERGNFPTRNRIVAGISEATVVIETDIKGGSMITADLAFSYNKEVFCFPGRVSDAKSAGCNHLIKKLKAQIITNANDLVEEMGWSDIPKAKPVQREIFIEMTEEEKMIVTVLKQTESVHIDELLYKSKLNNAQMAGAMLNLEMQDIIKVLPGKIIKLQ